MSQETEEMFGKFISLLAKAVEYLPDTERKDVRGEFLVPTGDSFSRTASLLEDFSTVKDFFLSRRDMEEGQ